MKNTFSITTTAPVNIAVIKYWGKRDGKLILPINGSISASLDHAQLRAKTTITACKDFKTDRMWLNGEEQSLSSKRLQNVLTEIRRLAKHNCENGEEINGDLSRMCDWNLHICSENNFPTAAGLASSAAGYACLAFSLAKLFKVKEDISLIARQGSGSACRSVYGGFVEWCMGTREDGRDSVARVIAEADHWPQMHIIVLVVSAKKKHVSSAVGMETSVKTSALLKYRAKHSVPERLNSMKKAILSKDFPLFAELTMKDSNEMHACCLDTFPSISYMTDVSRQIQMLVHHINGLHEQPIVTYTFDAGPNACLYLLEESIPEVMSYVEHAYRPINAQDWVRGLQYTSNTLPQEEQLNFPVEKNKSAIQYVIHTKVGSGPQVLEESESLLDADGMPKNLAENVAQQS